MEIISSLGQSGRPPLSANMLSSQGTVLIGLLITSTTCSAVPLHYFDIPELQTADHDLSFQGRQAQIPPPMNMTTPTNLNSTTSLAPETTSQLPPASNTTVSPASGTNDTLTATPPKTTVSSTAANTTTVPTPATSPTTAGTTMTTAPTPATSPSSAGTTTTTAPTPAISTSTVGTTMTGAPTPATSPSSAGTTMTTAPTPATSPSTVGTTMTGAPTPATSPSSAGTTTTPATTSPTTTITTTSRPRPVVGNCTLGDDILHILFNRTTVESGMFTLENSIGVVGSREEILNALMTHLGNHSRQDIEACLDLYRIPPEPAVGAPDPAGASQLGYQRPGWLGGQPFLPVPRPASDNFVYGHGYTTYQRPFNIAQRVPLYSPAAFLRANSLQDLFQSLARDFLTEFNLFWEHGSPAFWFDRNAAPRRPRAIRRQAT